MSEIADDALVVFTDGSYLQDIRGGAAAASLNEVRTATFTPPVAFSNNEMELMGIALTLRAAHFPVQPKSGQSLVKFLKNHMRRLPEGTSGKRRGKEDPPPNEFDSLTTGHLEIAEAGGGNLPTQNRTLPTQCFLHRFKRTVTKYCKECGVSETVSGFIFYCRRYRSQRKLFRTKVKTGKLRTNIHRANVSNVRVFR
ncbi:hypothetical protein CROQUDRAFT_103619 [Cronartium quercuum f. sp. fusiforme G11]|uniref:Uncharacterized protein n=1 Tax=Cronartium quercuum f. sp. fusiforme G11 TaxID=708437 RepID=A0A9P6TG22_9BASI|nr:hypothetical protein CROQUDRAFT_103619 [Cronartium quercuum f. sp. fusiforme G11]